MKLHWVVRWVQGGGLGQLSLRLLSLLPLAVSRMGGLPALIQELDCIRKQVACVSESSNRVDNPIGFRLTITLTDLIGICRKVTAFARLEDLQGDFLCRTAERGS